MTVVVLLGAAVVMYAAGRRHQAYAQSRTDVRDQRGKLVNARRARALRRWVALRGWSLAGAVLLLVGLIMGRLGGRT